MLSFVFLDILGEYAKSLYVHSLCRYKLFPSILPIGQDLLAYMEKSFMRSVKKKEHSRAFTIYAKILYAHSPYAPKFFTSILHIPQYLLCSYGEKFREKVENLTS
jgi:hypothetical protein